MFTEADLKRLAEVEFQIENTRFRITKMNAYDAVPYFDKIREQIARVLGGTVSATDNNETAAGALITGVLGIDGNFRAEIQNDMFKLVEWRRAPQFDRWHGLEGMEQQAFRELEYTDVYEVLIRVLVVNFLPKRQGIVSFIKSLVAN